MMIKIIAQIFGTLKWMFTAVALLAAAYIMYQMVEVGRATFKPIWWITDHIGITRPVPDKPIEERDVEAKNKCRAYTLLADFAGAKIRSEPDKIRVLCTVMKIEERGVDPCDIFADQMELVPPGWGRRKMGLYLPWLGRKMYVPHRQFFYVEREFNQQELDAAMLLTAKVRTQKLCPPGWNAVTLIRPNRDKTVGNQSDEEVAAIRQSMVLQSTTQSEYEFFRIK